jgi:ethanolamine utilization microcompartment shell protein EutL
VLTLPAVTENVAEVDPCGTVIEAGTVATVGDALNAIVAPPLNAGEVSATVQVDPAVAVSDVGLHEIPLKEGV